MWQDCHFLVSFYSFLSLVSNGHLTIRISNNCVDIRLLGCLKTQTNPMSEITCLWQETSKLCAIFHSRLFRIYPCLTVWLWKETNISFTGGRLESQRCSMMKGGAVSFLQSSTVSGFHLSLQQRTAAHLNIIKNKQKKRDERFCRACTQNNQAVYSLLSLLL